MIELDPDHADDYFSRGIAKVEIEDYEEAIADLDKAIKLNPKNAGAYCGRGFSKSQIGDYRGALADFKKVIKLDPKNANQYKKLIKATKKKLDNF